METNREKRLKNPVHRQNQDYIDHIAKLEKENRRLWRFIMKNVDDVSELL